MPQNSDDAPPGNLRKHASVQVKTPTIISLQNQAPNLHAETQTPNLAEDDSYEASVLRGGPRPVTARQQKSFRFYINGAARRRQEMTLSDRFLKLAADDSDSDILLGVEQSAIVMLPSRRENKPNPKTAKVAPTVGGKPVIKNQTDGLQNSQTQTQTQHTNNKEKESDNTSPHREALCEYPTGPAMSTNGVNFELPANDESRVDLENECPDSPSVSEPVGQPSIEIRVDLKNESPSFPLVSEHVGPPSIAPRKDREIESPESPPVSEQEAQLDMDRNSVSALGDPPIPLLFIGAGGSADSNTVTSQSDSSEWQIQNVEVKMETEVETGNLGKNAKMPGLGDDDNIKQNNEGNIGNVVVPIKIGSANQIIDRKNVSGKPKELVDGDVSLKQTERDQGNPEGVPNTDPENSNELKEKEVSKPESKAKTHLKNKDNKGKILVKGGSEAKNNKTGHPHSAGEPSIMLSEPKEQSISIDKSKACQETKPERAQLTFQEETKACTSANDISNGKELQVNKPPIEFSANKSGFSSDSTPPSKPTTEQTSLPSVDGTTKSTTGNVAGNKRSINNENTASEEHAKRHKGDDHVKQEVKKTKPSRFSCPKPQSKHPDGKMMPFQRMLAKHPKPKSLHVEAFLEVMIYYNLYLCILDGQWMKLEEVIDFMMHEYNLSIVVITDQGKKLEQEEVVAVFTLCPIVKMNYYASTLVRERLGIHRDVWEFNRTKLMANDMFREEKMNKIAKMCGA